MGASLHLQGAVLWPGWVDKRRGVCGHFVPKNQLCVGMREGACKPLHGSRCPGTCMNQTHYDAGECDIGGSLQSNY